MNCRYIASDSMHILRALKGLYYSGFFNVLYFNIPYNAPQVFKKIYKNSVIYEHPPPLDRVAFPLDQL